MKKILLYCFFLFCFIGCNNAKDSTIDSKPYISSHNDIFKTLESQFNDPLVIIASIMLKINAIPNIANLVESSQDKSIISKHLETYREYHNSH